MAARKPDLAVRLFGNFSMEVDGRPFVMATPRRTLPILAYLLLNRGTAVSREFLAYFMWPDDPEESARTKLRSNLYDLARILPPAPAGHWIVADGDNVAWNSDARLRLDVEDFERCCAEPERREEGVELYRGELLAALYDEWIFPPRERYRNTFLATLTDLVSEARRRRDFPRAIARAQQLLGVDPWREDVVRRLIAIRYESGDRTGALVEYQRFAERLRAELDIEPMPETVALRDAIARDAPIEPESPAAPSRRPAEAQQASLPFVGREFELESLHEAWSRATRGNGSAVFVGGESGIGKSRLALEFAHRVEESGGRVISGATGTPEAIPYQSIVEALRTALPLVASLRVRDAWLAGIATLVPELRGHLPGLPELSRMQTDDERARLFEALIRTLAALAQPRPLLVLLEDVQWAEEATSAAIEFMLKRLTTLRILFVLTYRDDEVPRLQPLQRVRRDATIAGSARSISLRALEVAEVGTLLRVLPVAADASAASLHAASAGNPLFLTQLLEGGTAGLATANPDGVRALVTERIDKLSADARTIAEIAALAGARFSGEVVRRVSGWDGPAADDALDELIDRRIVRETSGRGFFDYAFTHQIVADTVAASAPLERSATRRRRIARALDELYPERAAELAAGIARHYDLAGDAKTAAARYLAACRHALSVGALDEAEAHVERGLALVADAPLRIELLLAAETLAERRAASEQRAALLTELDRLTAGTEGEERRTVVLRRFDFEQLRNGGAGAAAPLDELARLVAIDGNPLWLGRLRYAQGLHRLTIGELPGAEAAALDAVAAFLEAGERAAEAEARYRLAEVVTHRGDLARAESLLEEARCAGERAHDAPLSIRALKGAYQLAFSRRDRQRCFDIAQATLEAARASGDRRSEAEGHTRMGSALVSLGLNLREARAHFQAASDIYAEIGDLQGIAVTLVSSVQILQVLGDLEGAKLGCERALEIFATDPQPTRRTITALLSLSTAKVQSGDVAGGVRDANRGLELARALGYRVLEASALEDLAYAEAAAGETVAAIEHMEHSLTLRAETDSLAWTSISLAHLAQWSAQIGNLEAARSYAAQTFEREAGLAQATPFPQSAYWALAQALRACGDEAGAARCHETARALTLAAVQKLDEADRGPFLALPWHRELMA